ncbi:MAG: hypothetical protein MSC45_07015 [Mobiluncus sp.]|uniref:hypothetical protein n=1 Tax=Mobiluncus sp. TaxID=47293 RepID=UPI00258B8086|nr:hypothetical protein [Mobiluncus sp.]MCI6584800.1 hypothetical protein [Mobiluncus sp.]
MITIHDATATTFEATGLGVLDLEIINPEVSEELNQSFTLSFDYPATGTYAEHMKLENIVACTVPYTQVRQAFRISTVEVDLKGILHIEAAHLFFDLAGSVIGDLDMVSSFGTARPRSAGSTPATPLTGRAASGW